MTGLLNLIVAAAAISDAAATTNDSIGADGKFTDLDDIVVTATRTPKSLKDVPVVTRVIPADDIKKSDATNIQDLLTEELPGLEFGFAMSQETSLNMNGFGGSAVLFLVDGERLAGETMDNVDYSRLNLDNIGRVEIVKGASSALYGANAVGGVVNLISNNRTDPWHLNINSRYRSFGNEWRAGGELSLNQGNWNSSTTAQYTKSNTVRLTGAFDTESSIHEIYGGNSLNIKERLTYHVLPSLRLIARGAYFDRKSNRSNYSDKYNDYTGGLKGVWDISPADNLELSYSYDQYDKKRFEGGIRTHGHDYSNRQHIAHGLFSHFWQNSTLTVGADYMNDFLKTYQFTDGGNHSQYNVDAFAQFDWRPLWWLNVVTSVRADYYSASDQGWPTARVALMFKPKPLTIRASYAGGFRAPTLKEMYMSFDMAGIQMIYGNPNLKAEKSQNFNLSLERNGAVRSSIFEGAYSLTATANYSYYDSRITTTDFHGDADREEGAIYTNEDGVKMGSIDVSMRYKFRFGLGLKAGYNYMHMWGRKIDSQFNQPRPHSANFRVDYEHSFGKYYTLYAGISGRYKGTPETRLEQHDKAYSIWKLTIEQKVWKGISVNFIVDNLFNYRPKVYYWNSEPTNGTSWSLGLSLDINNMFN